MGHSEPENNGVLYIPQTQKLESHHQMQFSVICGTFQKDAVTMFYSLLRQQQFKSYGGSPSPPPASNNGFLTIRINF